jgi:tripartite-type tricarboxylate transporter receptor subunit TctC
MHRIDQATWNRRDLLGTLAAGAAAALPLGVLAQSFPSRPMRILSTSAAGAMGDVLARLLGQQLQLLLGQPVVIENRPGAGGHIACEAAARSAPDGYTSVITGSTVASLAPILFPALNYDPERDLLPVGYTSAGMHLLLTNPATGVQTLEEFVELAKRKGADINYASGGNGHPLHLYTEEVQSRLGTRMTHIPYKGMPAALQALSTNDVQFMVSGTPDSAPYIQSRKVRVLATTGPFVEGVVPASTPNLGATHPDLMFSGWIALSVPRKTPADVVAVLEKALQQLAERPDYIKGLQQLGNVPIKGSSAEVARALAADIARNRATARALKLQQV